MNSLVATAEQYVSTRLESITPEQAKDLLKRNHNNRSISWEKVFEYGRAMARGEWQVVHQGIALSEDGTLLDGQHRLCAIIKSGETVPMYVTRGLKEDARVAIDKGRARNPADELELRGLDHGRERRAIANVLSESIHGIYSATTPEIIRTCQVFKDGLELVLANDRRQHGIARAPLKAAVALAYRTNPQGVKRFWESYLSCANLDQNSPVLALRHLVMGGVNGVGRPPSHFGKKLFLATCRCIEAYLRGERLTSARASYSALDIFLASHGLKSRREFVN